MFNQLNKEQIKVVESSLNHISVVAGAGTGKTTVLLSRVKFLIQKLKINPCNLLLLTFSKNAAKEMYERCDFKKVKIRTFHGFCLYFLRNIVKKKINLINDAQKIEIIKFLLATDYTNYFKEHFDNIQNLSQDITNKKKNIDNIDESLVFLKFYEFYQYYLKKNNYFDFDDLLNHTYQILNNQEHFLYLVFQEFKHLLIDEVQDIDDIQFKIIKLLGKKMIIFMVGDPNQSIYSFRGCKNEYLNYLEKYFNMQCFFLKVNYRSPVNLVNLSNKLLDKKFYLVSGVTDINKKGIFSWQQFYNQEEEFNFLVQKIKDLINNGYHYRDIAILYRFSSACKSKNFDLKKKLNFQKISGIILSTIHKAKGLEYKICFLIGCENESFFSSFSDNYFNKDSEEIRLFYVALTRACEYLYLTSVKKRFINDEWHDNCEPLCFIQKELNIKKNN